MELCNTGSSGDDPVDEIRIYKNINYGGFLDASACDDITGWEKTFINTKKACHYIAESSSSHINPGYCETFGFHADTPTSGCQMQWKFETRDITDTWLEAFDSTGIDNLDPVITKEVIGTQSENCPPEQGEICWMLQETKIHVNVIDSAGECDPPSLVEYCAFSYTLDGDPEEAWTVYADENGEVHETILFDEDSEHILTVECYDNAGNDVTDVETFRVDNTPPVTTKLYGDTHYPLDINTGGAYPHYITTSTPITLTPKDGGEICHVDGETTYYRNFVVDNNFCEYELDCLNGQFNPEIPFLPYDVPFYKQESSCHVIEFYSVDALGNEEETKRQCVYVEDQAPTGTKNIGDPKYLVIGMNQLPAMS